MTSRQIVHFIGVSVVEDKRSFQAPLRDWAEANGFEVHFSGFGGMNFVHLPHLIDLVGSEHDLTDKVVVLDVSSSRERDWFDQRRRKYDEAANDLLERIAHYRIRPVFLHFYRREIDRERDTFRDFLNGLAARNDVPVVDLVDPVFAYLDRGGDVDVLFRDKVHTTPEGAEFYGGLLIDQFARIVSAEPLAADQQRVPFFKAIEIARDIGTGIRTLDTRHGVRLTFAELSDGRDVEINLPAPARISSLFVLAGPDSGYVAVLIDDDPTEHEIACFDPFSYYPHVCLAPVGLPAQRRLRIKALDKRPAAEALSKGEWSDAPRMSLISHIFTRPDRPA